jgi:hypothetical protein
MEGINPSSQPIFNRDIEDAEYEDIDNTEDAYTFDPRMDEKEPTIAVESLLSDAELELQS